ncbi:MAG: 50S ribosomal protein L6 [Patescibacteria group bacterium]
MSKIGKLPIEVPNTVTITLTNDLAVVKGPKGELSVAIPKVITIKQEGSQLLVTRINEDKPTRALHGLIRSLVANAVEGVTNGFTKTLEINGVGYRAELKGQVVVLHLGFSHPVEVPILNGVEVKLEKNQVIISGIDKQQVGEMAAVIRSHKKPEPYKGKGIKYIDEIVRRKAGKTAATGKSAG